MEIIWCLTCPFIVSFITMLWTGVERGQTLVGGAVVIGFIEFSTFHPDYPIYVKALMGFSFGMAGHYFALLILAKMGF